MKKKSELALNILFSFISLVIGAYGIAILIGVGEAANNSIVAFAAVSIPFAIITFLFAFLAPKARWFYAGLISGPVAILAMLGSWSGGGLLLGALCTVGLTLVGASLGSKFKAARIARRQPPPAGPS